MIRLINLQSQNWQNIAELKQYLKIQITNHHFENCLATREIISTMETLETQLERLTKLRRKEERTLRIKNIFNQK